MRSPRRQSVLGRFYECAHLCGDERHVLHEAWRGFVRGLVWEQFGFCANKPLQGAVRREKVQGLGLTVHVHPQWHKMASEVSVLMKAQQTFGGIRSPLLLMDKILHGYTRADDS